MERRKFKIVYGIGWAVIAIIRIPYRLRARTALIVVDRKTAREKSLLALASVGLGALPLVYILTPWLNFANYKFRSWAGWLGGASFAAGLGLLWRAHADLGQNWSDSLQLRQEHQLITGGIYRHIRHPMYAFGWLMSIAQALLLQNWIAGLSGLASFALLYFSRVPREEHMMLERFGEAYQEYIDRTARIVPRSPWQAVVRDRRGVGRHRDVARHDTERPGKDQQL